jgi:ATP-binding cassette subfamily C protein LapB
VADARVDDYIKPPEPHWLWQLALKEWPRYVDVMMASVVANVLTLASMLFTRLVYDRVIPAQSEPTLWVLFSGLLLALALGFCIRTARTHISDQTGKRADLRISDRVFGHALRIRSDARPPSTGAFISQIRELEQVRELATSSTVGAMADLPFFLLFVVVMWWMGGHLVWVPLAALPLLLVPGLLAQRPLARLTKEGMREGSIRNAMLVEVVQGLDDIKLLRAEPRFQSQWNHLNEVIGQISLRQRFLSALLTHWTQEVQTLAYAGVVLVGAYSVMAGEMSTGTLVACSMLVSRMMGPLAQVTGIMTRWQQAQVAREGLDKLMQRPVDQPERSRRVHRPVLWGDYEIEQLQFRYAQADPRPSLDIAALKIGRGEKVAVLGRNGAGKSTLLQALAGLQRPQVGQVYLDGIQLDTLDPADVRRDVALLNQNASLFFGTVRDNITLGMPHASDEDVLRAVELSGAGPYLRGLPDGLDHPLLEGGRGLSGGQRQALLLARTLIRDPRVLLLDEPTAWLDETTERSVIEAMAPWLVGRTLVIATHRPAVLQWVDRVIVVEGGRVVADSPKDKMKVRRAAARPASETQEVSA